MERQLVVKVENKIMNIFNDRLLFCINGERKLDDYKKENKIIMKCKEKIGTKDMKIKYEELEDVIIPTIEFDNIGDNCYCYTCWDALISGTYEHNKTYIVDFLKNHKEIKKQFAVEIEKEN